jgi:hypothetical protein
MDMSETYGTTGTEQYDTPRDLGSVEVTPGVTPDAVGTTAGGGTSGTSGGAGTTDVAKDEARATGEQAKEGARHVAEVGKDEAKNVVQETGQQAKELWQQTRSQLMEQSAQQQTRVADGLRSLSEELSGMARGSEQQGVASDLAHQASQRMGDVATWLDQRDPGSLVSEVKQFARQRPGAFLATAAVIGLVGGRLSRGLVAEHQDQQEQQGAASYTGLSGAGSGTTAPVPVDHSTSGYSAYGSPTGTVTPAAPHPVTDPVVEAGGITGVDGPVSGTSTEAGEYPR